MFWGVFRKTVRVIENFEVKLWPFQKLSMKRKKHIKIDNFIIPFYILVFCTRSGNDKCYNASLKPCVGSGWDDLIMGS